MHLRWTMDGPHSSYSCLEIHICWKVEREARMDPPIQTEYFLSGGAMILILMVDGARAVISFCIRSAIPGYMVVPPDITLHDGVVGGFMDATGFHSQEGRLEQSLGASEPLVSDGDDLTVRKLIGLLQGGRGSSSGHFLLEVQSDIAELLLDIPDNLPLSSGGEGVSTLSQDLHQVVGQLTTSQVQADDGMGESITFID